MQAKVINFFGGPGVGKSTTAAGVFHELKKRGIECEYVTEYAKDAVYDHHNETLKNQFFVSAQQHHKIWRVINYYKKKDQDVIIITDSPLITGLFYIQNQTEAYGFFSHFLLSEFIQMSDFPTEYKPINFIINRSTKYNPNGRNQTEEQAKEIDESILDFFDEYNLPCSLINSDCCVKDLVDKILES